VLCRLLGETEDPRRGAVRQRLWAAAEALLPDRRVGDFNQALMELGALVCTPVAPRCSECPLAAVCEARRLGKQDAIPRRASPPETVTVQEAAVVVRRGDSVLLVQRSETATRWAGMWEFPHGPVQEGETHEAAAVRLLRELTGMRADLGPELQTLRHGVTRFQITLVCFEARFRGGRFRSAFYRRSCWVRPDELGGYPVSAPQRRLAKALVDPDRQRLLF
jgi:A/G-specific adenine glycosylase